MIKLRGADGRIHAETLLTAIGALAGFSAQNAALDQASRAGVLPQYSLLLAGTASGDQYLVGNWINAHLFNDPGARYPFLGLVGGAAIQAGVDPKEFPDCNEIAKHVVTSLGGAEFGIVRAPPNHQPRFRPSAILEGLWSFVCDVLRLPPPDNVAEGEPPLQETYWPIIFSIVAAQFLGMTKEVLDPRISFALAMEAAVIAAKIHPDKITPGKWKTDSADGVLKVTRLLI